MDVLSTPGGMAAAGGVVLVLVVLMVASRRGRGVAARNGLIKRGRYSEAARLAADANDLAAAFDLYVRAQEPENAAAIAIKRGEVRHAAELYERVGNLERAAHFYQRANMAAKAEELRARMAPTPGLPQRTSGVAPVRTRAQELEDRYREAAAGATSAAARAEVQRLARDAADAYLADGELATAAEIYADAGLEDEAVHLYVNVLGQPGRAAPLVARRGNHQRAAELYELAGELERAATTWVDVARASPRPDSFLERIADLSPKVALGFVEQEVAARPLSKATAEWHYQRAKLTAAGGDAARAQSYFEQLQALVGPYRDVDARLRGLVAEPAPAARGDTLPGPGSNLDATQIELLASQIAEAAAQQLKRRVELSALPEASASPSVVVRTEIRVVGLEQAPLIAGLLDDTAVAAARHGASLETLKRFTGGRPCDLGNIEVYYRLGLYYLAHGAYEDALVAFDAVEDTSPAYRDGWKRAEEIRAWKKALGKATRLAESDAAPQRDRYELRGELGRGGMAVVYRAFDTLLGRDVALKFLSEELSTQTGIREMFQREARAVAALNHPNIVTVHDTGYLQGRAFLCMEFVSGESVEALQNQGTGLTIIESLRIVTQVLDALTYAHGKQIIHRDIKPANIMRTPEGLVKLMDFGLAKSLAEGKKQSVIAGTPAYMPPEQLGGGEIDHRCDVFAVAVSLYEMLTGRMPYEGFDRGTKPTPLSALVPAVPAPLEEAVMRGLAARPAERWASAAEMNQRIKLVLDAVNQAVAVKSAGANRKMAQAKTDIL
ncbi:MAG: serine/threonine protein kinase [Myxococcales bacterium]|nr:serine/threonine protein kinase [Myxococcales bacterium]